MINTNIGQITWLTTFMDGAIEDKIHDCACAKIDTLNLKSRWLIHRQYTVIAQDIGRDNCYTALVYWITENNPAIVFCVPVRVVNPVVDDSGNLSFDEVS